MSSWHPQTIGNTCEILDNKRIPLSSEQRSKIKGEIPYYGANGIVDYISKHLFDESLILLAEDGGHFEEYQDRSIAYKITGKSWVNNHAHILRVKTGHSFEFVFYSLEHKNVLAFIKGGTRSKLNQNELRIVEFDCPPLPQQRKIAKILTTVDNQIEKTEELIAKYESVKQGMMQDLFTRGVDENGKLRPKREDAPELYKETELGWVPREWEVKSLAAISSVIDPQPDHRTPKEVVNGIPYIGIGEFDNDGQINFRKARKISYTAYKKQKKSFSIDEGDFIFGKIGTIGSPKKLYSSTEYALSANVILVKPYETPMFLFFWISCPRAEQLVNQKLHTTSQPAFGIQKLREFLIPLPLLNERLAIEKLFHNIARSIKAENTNLTKLKHLKTALMQDLLTGKVEVTPDPEDN
ncbi:restriction endonuclease subunit S [Maridesulfovibrio zosterae]|uniref:restriction endonuclease subunit S n=1 Tax=Maridesulfovibrio zosterae TaxID=82171 RepID=UPI00040F35D3|nr:restriction endonuclease subunit S [Maridesulfovibrio zosterae]